MEQLQATVAEGSRSLGNCNNNKKRLPTISYRLIITVSIKLSVANFIPTRKGSLLLVHNGFAFRLKNKLAYGKKQWYCTSRTKTGCQVDVTTVVYRNGNLIKRVRNIHNHPVPGFYRRNDGSFKVV
ncbi:hypothetical protein evm_005194 [Chilo suppressalis]|nr:hypothetical protein evm_005194 [Chilo suppressalis]